MPARQLLRGLLDTRDETPISLVTTDSRRVCEGCIFVAFPGQNFDGHAFVAQALAQGAAYAVVNHLVPGAAPERQILFPSSYGAMLRLGANYRSAFSPKVIGVTGSVGKTTTKQFCSAVFAAFGQTIFTQGNQNNELGVPNTLFQIGAQTEYAVVEMGMNHAGEIERLATCARPDVGVITCIGTAHIENLGSRENICKAKLEICQGLPDGAPLVLNGNDALLRAAALPGRLRPVWFALEDASADVYATDIVCGARGSAFVLHDRQQGHFSVTIPAMGRHNVVNALAAYCAATRLGLDGGTAAAALARFEQTGMRQRVVERGGLTVIEDCYNANPDSMRAALEMFRAYPCARRFAVLGDMLELGAESEEAHRQVGVQAAQAGLAGLIAYGPQSRCMAQAARAQGLETLWAETPQQAAQPLLRWLQPGDAVLLKASRGMKLEAVLQLLYAAWPE